MGGHVLCSGIYCPPAAPAGAGWRCLGSKAWPCTMRSSRPAIHPQVVAENTTDEWSVHRPRELKPGPFAATLYVDAAHKPAPGELKEKNW